jgi:hypothetical protein
MSVRIVHGSFGPMSFQADEWEKGCISEIKGVRRVELPGAAGRSLIVLPLPVPDERGTVTVSSNDFLVEASWVRASERLDAMRAVDSLERAP